MKQVSLVVLTDNQIQYLHTILWTPTVHLTRISILYLLLRLTPIDSTKSRRFLYVVIITSYIFLLITCGLLIFECAPVHAAFDLKARLTGHCLGTTSMAMYGTLCLVHATLDLLTILPPMIVISKLHMSRSKKINLFILLGVGCLAVICTIVRIFVYYKRLISSYDFTSKYCSQAWSLFQVSLTNDVVGNTIPIGFWSIIESSLAVTVACLPAINQFLRTQAIRVKDNMTALMSRTPPSDGTSGRSSRFDPRVNAIHISAFRVFRGPIKSTYSASATATSDMTLKSYHEIEVVQDLERGLDYNGRNREIKVSKSVDIRSEELPPSPPPKDWTT